MGGSKRLRAALEALRAQVQPSWDVCRWCGAQLYHDYRLAPGESGYYVPRLDLDQVHCPASDPPGRPHDADLAELRARLSRPRCDQYVAIDGPDRPSIECPNRAVHRLTYRDDPRGLRARQGCHRHFPAILQHAEDELRISRRRAQTLPGRATVSLVVPEVAELVYERSTRDLAHGRPGRWVAHPIDGPVRHRLF